FLFEIIMRRHEVKSTMMTSNRPLEDWGKLVGDVPAASAILDRFLHHAEVINISGRSYRLRNRRVAEEAPADGPEEANQLSGRTKKADQEKAERAAEPAVGAGRNQPPAPRGFSAE